MTSRTKKPSSDALSSAPVTFDLVEDTLTRLERSRVAAGMRTTSEVVRAAVDRFDFEACTPSVGPERRQISVRLSAEQRLMLKRVATRKKTSIGELLRLAVEALPVPKVKPGQAKFALVKAKPAPAKKASLANKASAKSRAKR